MDHGQFSPPTPAVSYSPVIPSPSFASSPEPSSTSTTLSSESSVHLDSADFQNAVDLGESISKKLSESENAAAPVENNPANPPRLAHASQLTAQLSSNPKIAALRSGLSVIPAPSPSLANTGGSPILSNPKCSGYFVEPVRLCCFVICTEVCLNAMIDSSSGWTRYSNRATCRVRSYVRIRSAAQN